MANVATRIISGAFFLLLGVVFFGRLFNVWDGDPLVPLLFMVLMSTNTAIYQVALGTLGGLITLNQKLADPPPSIAEQIERQAQQN